MNYKFYNTITFGLWAAGLALLWILFTLPVPNWHFGQQQIQVVDLSEVR